MKLTDAQRCRVNRLWDAIAWLVNTLVWDVLDRGGKWARESHVPLAKGDE